MSDVVNQFNTLDSSTKQQIYKDLRIVGLAADDSACGHYRMVNPLTYLNSLGARCEWYNYSRPDMVEWADIVITQRSYDRVLQTDVLNRLGKMGKTIVYEIDDNLHCVDPDSHAFGVFHPGSPELTAAGRNMADCDGMTVSTLELAGMYQSMNPNIRYVPNAIDFEMRDWEYVPPEKDPRFIYLGISGGLTHTPDWKDFDAVVKPLLDKYKNVKLALYTGKQMVDFLMNRWQLDMDRVEIVPPQSFHDYPKNLGWFDIGLGPLKNIRFNSAKCVDSDTRVALYNKGLTKVGDIVPGDHIWNGTSYVEVLAKEVQAPQEGLEIKTQFGYKLRITDTHQQPTTNGIVLGKDLKVGDTVYLGSYQFAESYVELPCHLWTTQHVGRNRVEVPVEKMTSLPKVVIDETWGELLGIFVGDGTINNTSIAVTCDSQDEDVIERYNSLVNAIGLPTTIRQSMTFTGDIVNSKVVSTNSNKLVKFFEDIGVAKDRKRIVRVPEIIEKSPKSVVRAFLRGYFEADGTCTKLRGGVSATSKDLEMVEGCQKLLLGFGIKCKIKGRKGPKAYSDRTYYTLSINQAYQRLFAEEIGFISKRKNDKVAENLTRRMSNNAAPAIFEDTIEEISRVNLNPIDIQVQGELFVANGIITHNSNLRILEWSAKRIPGVFSVSAAYSTTIRNGVNGFTASSKDEWIDKASYLIENEDARRQMGDVGYQMVRDHFDQANIVHEWVKAWKGIQDVVVGKRVPPTYRSYFGNLGRNEPCPCGSGLKYKKCQCAGAFG